MERNHICKKCGGIAGWDSYYQSWICTRCGYVERKPITIYDRIISKTPEELAEWLERIRLCCSTDLCGRSCPLAEVCYSNAEEPKETLDWLKEEVEDAT